MAKQESFFASLTRLFRSGPSVRRKIKGYDDKGYYDKKASLAGRTASSGGPLPFGKNSNNYSMMGGSDMMARTARYMTYGAMEFTPICSKALDIIADECCSGDERGKNFHVFSENADIKATLEELFYDVANVDFNLRVWIRNLAKYGDFFAYNEVIPGQGVVNIQALPVNEVERIEGFDQEDPYAVKFKWSKINRELENWQVLHLRILGNDQYNPYGQSMLDSARSIWEKYCMMVDAMLVYRLVRSPDRRVFYIDVGTVAPNDIPNYMNTVMATIRGNHAVDKSTGRIDERYNPIAIDEDFVVPVRGANSGTKIEPLPGGQNATAIEDIELMQNQLFAALGVPKPWLGYDDNLSCFLGETKVALLDGRNLSMIDIKKELDQGKELWTYSMDLTTKEIVPGKITNSWMAKKVKKLVKVTLDNGESFTCTPEHKWLNREGVYQKAETLIPGTSLMPLYTRVTGKDTGKRSIMGYEQVFNPGKNSWEYTHRLIDQFMFKNKHHTIKNRRVIHHINGDKRNNAPNNLQEMNFEEHRIHHQNDINEKRTKAIAEGKWNGKNNGYYQACFKKIKHLYDMDKLIQWCKENKPTRASHLYKGKRFIKEIGEIENYGLTEKWFISLLKNNNMTYKEFAEKYMANGYIFYRKEEVKSTNICKKCNQEFYASPTHREMRKFCSKICRKDFYENKNNILNHKVVSVDFIESENEVEVWDIEVAIFHNFTLTNSVMVSNSKSTLAMEDSRFSHTIQVLQRIVISELNKLAILHLYAKGFDGEDLLDFELKLSNPSSIAMQQKLDLWKTKIDIIGAVDSIETKFLPFDLLYKEILGFSRDDIAWIKEGLKSDKKFAIELNLINTPDNVGENTVDPFDGTSYQIPGGTQLNPNNGSNENDNSGTSLPGQEGGSSGSKLEDDGITQLSMSLGATEAPIKDNPRVRMDKRNKDRERSEIEKNSQIPNFRKMLSPSKNPALRDIYDSEFLKSPFNPIYEIIENDIKKGISKKAFLSKEIRTMLENFDKKYKVNKSNSRDNKLLVEENEINLSFLEEGFEISKENYEILEEPLLDEGLKELGLELKSDKNTV